MSIASHELVYSEPNGIRLEVQYKFTDHLANEYVYNKLVAVSFDTEADMLSMIPEIEAQLAYSEVAEAVGVSESGPLDYSITPDHQTKPEYIRRVLGEFMKIPSVDHFNNGFQFFKDFELDPDSGNNKPQRSAYLSVDTATYDLIDKRFNDLAGIQTFINDEKGRVWDDTPEGYW